MITYIYPDGRLKRLGMDAIHPKTYVHVPGVQLGATCIRPCRLTAGSYPAEAQ